MLKFVSGLIVAAVCIWLSMLLFEVVWSSDLPMWLKWMLLK